MTAPDISALRDRARNLEPVLRIGKNGLTQGTIDEIVKQLKDKRLIKIKMLRAFFEGKDRRLLAKEMAEKTGAVLVQQVGFVAVLWWPGKGQG